MDSGGYNNDNLNEQNRNRGQITHRERGGLIPINAHILNVANVTSEEVVEYQKVQLGDIIIVGYVVGYQEFEARVKVSIWDQTGVVDVTFFNQNENQDSSGLSNFYYEQGKKKPVKIFGTVKVYKKEKNLQGAKIIGVTDNEVTFHILEVINAWLYLTGQLEALKKNNYKNDMDSARVIAQGNNYGNNNYGNNYGNNYNNAYGTKDPIEMAQNILNDISRKSGKKIKKGDLTSEFTKKIKNEKPSILINRLLEEGFIMDDDEEHYQIC